MNRNLIRITFLSIFVFVFLNCNKDKKKVIDFGVYEIKVPKTWKKFEAPGIDSRVYGIITHKGDSVYNSYGINSRKFDDQVQVFSYEQIAKYDSLGLDTTYLVYSKEPKLDENQGTFLNEYYYYDTISNFRAKFRIPKKTGEGFIGISIDSLNNKGDRLVIFAEDVDNESQTKLIEAFKTIKIR